MRNWFKTSTKSKPRKDPELEVWYGLVAGGDFGEVSRRTVAIHGRAKCLTNGHCPFHNPSTHPLDHAEILLRFDKGAVVERVCKHGVGHTDPDSLAYYTSMDPMWGQAYGPHACDGCCL